MRCRDGEGTMMWYPPPARKTDQRLDVLVVSPLQNHILCSDSFSGCFLHLLVPHVRLELCLTHLPLVERFVWHMLVVKWVGIVDHLDTIMRHHPFDDLPVVGARFFQLLVVVPQEIPDDCKGPNAAETAIIIFLPPLPRPNPITTTA